MIRTGSLLIFGGRVALMGLFAAVLASSSPVHAADIVPPNAQAAQQAIEGKQKGEKEGAISKTPNDCFEDKGCMARTATSSDKATDGVTCTSGMACVYPGTSCVIGGSKHCKNFDLGGGNCTCACM